MGDAVPQFSVRGDGCVMCEQRLSTDVCSCVELVFVLCIASLHAGARRFLQCLECSGCFGLAC